MKEILRKIKYSRLKPVERFLINIFSNLTEYKNDKFPNSIFYKYNNLLIVEYEITTNTCYMSFDNIYNILNKSFNIISDEKITSDVKENLKNYLNINTNRIFYTIFKDNNERYT
jgi:hypothetical protein